MASDHGKAPYHAKDHWLSRGKMLRGVVKDELLLFAFTKRQVFCICRPFCGDRWLSVACYLEGISEKNKHINI